jgi:hypothetical protein
MSRPIWLLLVPLSACSRESAEVSLDAPSAETDMDDVAPNNAPEEELPPSDAPYWSLNADLTTPAAGPEDLALELTIWREPGHPECLFIADITSVEPIPAPEGEPITIWLRVSLSAPADAGCRWGGPTTIDLGIGAWNPALDSAASAAGVPSEYAAYIQTGAENPLWVFGVATLDGLAEPAPETPPDGQWHLRTLHLLPR